MLYHDFVPTTKNYIRIVMSVRGEWLLDAAEHYYDMGTFPEGSAKRSLEKIYNKVKRDRSNKF